MMDDQHSIFTFGNASWSSATPASETDERLT
jgi:hypothetical protein